MHCKHCGTKAAEGANFCAGCGEAVEGLTGQPAASAKKKPKYWASILAGAVAFLAVMIGGFLILSSEGGSRTPEAAAIKYLNALVRFDYQGIHQYNAFSLEGMLEEFRKMEGMTQKELADLLYEEQGVRSLRELFEMVGKESKQNAREAFGRNYKITFTVIDVTSLSKAALRDWIEEFEWYYEPVNAGSIVRHDKITEMLEMEVRATISGNLDEATDELTVFVVKIDGKWIALDYELLFETMSGMF